MADEFIIAYREEYGRALTTHPAAEDVPQILELIRFRHGYLTSDEQLRLKRSEDPDKRRLLRSQLALREVMARHARDISHELYDDKFRFFFELLQNADDAKHTLASTTATEPCVKFTILDDKVVVDLTENIFELKDVLAVCSTGQSSKSAASAIGRKGFGFKAVFLIASTVHIQSGIWSFRLEHRHGEDGIGMVVPQLEPHDKSLPRHLTRITLNFDREGQNANIRSDLCDWIRSQPVSVISFLRKVRKVEIALVSADGPCEEILFEQAASGRQGLQKLIATIDGNKHVYAYREFSQSTTQILTEDDDMINPTIRFPVVGQGNNKWTPYIDPCGQYIFVYLPMRQFRQLPFLIHADFDLTGGRQDVADNLRNQKLKREIAILFADAVETFVTERGSALRYRWLSYLPVEAQSVSPFWSDLYDLIREELLDRKVFFSCSGILSKADRLRSLPGIFLHDGEPILSEKPGEIYSYSSWCRDSDAGVLLDLGVRELSVQEMLAQVQYDCQQHELSRLRTTNLHDSWHDAYAKLLISLMQSEGGGEQPDVTALLRRCALIPVKTRADEVEWRPSKEPVYFPFLEQQELGLQNPAAIRVTIPTDIGLTLLHPEAANNVTRLEMYDSLGVQHCSPREVRQAILDIQKSDEDISLENGVAHFEFLFWNAYSRSADTELFALSINHLIVPSNQLILRSTDRSEIACLVRLDKNHRYNQYFLHDDYAGSQLKSCVRGDMTWRQWLERVAGIRSHPSLNDPDDRARLHPLIIAVRDQNRASFLPMIQEYWKQSYSAACFSYHIKQAVLNSRVLCRLNTVVKLRNAWFPSISIVAQARSFGVEAALPILLLPDSESGCDISSWSALRDLDIPATTSLAFYTQVLTIMSSREACSEDKICTLYSQIGSLASTYQLDGLKKLFRDQAVIWNPEQKQWLSSSECVWRSEIPLQSIFVIASAYEEQDVQDLFQRTLGLEDATIESYILELQDRQAGQFAIRDSKDASKIYTVLRNTARDDESRQLIRSFFDDQPLIYYEGEWLRSEECIWHATATIENYTSIKEAYEELQDFFIEILQVRTVNAVFMIQELARAAESPKASIRDLMLETGKIMTGSLSNHQFRPSIQKLSTAQFLPCITSKGSPKFVAPTDSFFIADDPKYAVLFAHKLHRLNFSYQELTTLHRLFGLLDLQDRYLSLNVEVETTAQEKVLNESLTQRLRDCAFALSCCAVFHRSPLYSHDSEDVHQLLVAACVYTSADMKTEYTVKKNKTLRATADKARLVIETEQDHLSIVLPADKAERRSCLRGQLPRELAQWLGVADAGAERQIHRLINETELGTDQILASEDIPHTGMWFTGTQRPPCTDENSSSEGVGSDGEDDDVALRTTKLEGDEVDDSFAQATHGWRRDRKSSAAIPDHVDPVREPAEYGRFLEHLRRRAADVPWRANRQEGTLRSTDAYAEFFKEMANSRGNSTDPHAYPKLFGSDGCVNHRVGAAGEFFALELLHGLTRGRIGTQQWQSKIRHFATAHERHRNLERWSGRETADIVFDAEVKDERDNEQDHEPDVLKERFQNQEIGDSFDGWLPQWISGECTCSETAETSSMDGDEAYVDDSDPDDSCSSDEGSTSHPARTRSIPSSSREISTKLCEGCEGRNDEPLEWLFEIKTTLGPVGTPFFMSPKQFELMRTAGAYDGTGRRKVYCIVRIYNLLTGNIGIRMFIDAWRFWNNRLQLKPADTLQVKMT